MTRGKGEGSVYKRSDGRWVASIEAGYTEYGQRRRLRRVRPNKRQAIDALAAMRRQIGDPDTPTLARWLDIWLRDIVAGRVKAGQASATHAQRQEQVVRLYIKPRLGHLRLDKLTVGHVDDLTTSVLAAGKKPGTAQQVRAALSKALTDAVRRGLIPANPALGSTPPAGTATNPSAFDQAEYDRIIEACEHDPLGPLFVFMVLTGMRLSEATGLRWEDIDLDSRTYRVEAGVHRIGKNARELVGETGIVRGTRAKTRGASRPTPMSAAAVAVLEQAGPKRSGYVFASGGGGPRDPSHVRRAWMRLLKRAGVRTHTDGKGRGPHELRRTFATRARDAGVPIEDVQRLGRWDSPAMLLRHYSAVSEQRLRDAAEQVSHPVGHSEPKQVSEGVER